MTACAPPSETSGFRFSGHQTFPLRIAWIPKAVREINHGHDPLTNSDDGITTLGLGKNMVESLRSGSKLLAWRAAGTNRATARQISEITDAYLELQPHERDNFSIVLYNCDSKTLPTAVVEAISETEGDSPDDTTCRVILAHQNRKVLSEDP